jgi:radical SAM protein with 4Fe4S-binding SPASM domain
VSGKRLPLAPRWRHERFGAIVALEDPPILAHVDKELARELGIPPSPLWDQPPREPLEAPTEVHLTVTRRCPLRCSHCYTSSGPDAPTDEIGLDGWIARLDALARQGVFHVAIGGGEATARDDLLAIAEAARARGIVPNLTTSGAFVDDAFAERAARLFGQVNLSVDALAPELRHVFGEDKAALAERAVEKLVRAGVRVGLNVVVARSTFDRLDEVVAWAKERGLLEVELLRLKPAGRAAAPAYLEQRLTSEQRRALFPRVLELSRRHGIAIKLDCSAAPFVACHSPDVEVMERFEVAGCIGGLSLAGIDDRGRVQACSFFRAEDDPDARDLERVWASPSSFGPFRGYVENAREPCRSCDYLRVCRGGCRAVARFLTGDELAPDPECPRVEAHQQGC